MGLLGADNLFGMGYQPIGIDEDPNFLSFIYAIR